jgi:carboxypeptidase family protein
MKALRLAALASLLLLAMSVQLLAQTQITTGVIQGTVADPSGAVIAGASAEAANPDTNFTRTLSTDSNGRFVFLALPPGSYKVTVSAKGFATVVQENLNLTVGQAISLNISLKVSSVGERIVVTDTPTLDPTKTENSSTLSPVTVSTTPVLGRKFEDLLTLTPGVSIVQGPDGDEINFAGQRGIFNNVSLDGGDYNNGFFGEQMGGQRAAIDITMEAVQEFQVVATGAPAEFGRTAGGIVNVITKSGTNNVHGSAFHFQRLEALSSDTSDHKPLKDYSREQFGGTIGGPIKKDKVFFFGAFEQIIENLTRDNLSSSLGSCPLAAPVSSAANDPVIAGNTECQRLALLNFFKTTTALAKPSDEGQPIKHPIRNSAVLGKLDWNATSRNKLGVSYNFDRSRNVNQTFDVPTYGNSANGIEGTSLIHVINGNLFTTLSDKMANEAHLSYSRENRPRAAVDTNVPADTAMGFGTTFRFGEPFFLEPKIDEVFWRVQARDNVSILHGNHNIKFGGEWIHSRNVQIFRGFFNGRYIFDSVVGFLHYAMPAATGNGYGPLAGECAGGVFVNRGTACPGGTVTNVSPLLLYLGHADLNGKPTDAAGAADMANENIAFFLQDKWQIRPNFTLNYGLRWEGQVFPHMTIAPSKTAYGTNLSNPAFPSDGTIHNALDMWQPRIGFAWDIGNNQKSVLRASAGIYNATQNMLTQVGAITTNGVQQQTIFAGDVAGAGFISPNAVGGAAPVWPNPVINAPVPAGSFPFQPGITVFDKHYHNPRIYAYNVAFEQVVVSDFSVYVDFTMNHGVYLTRFTDLTQAGPVTIPANGDTVVYTGANPFPNLGSSTNTESTAHSLYRGLTVGMRKRFSHNFMAEANYTYSKDYDDDSNERDPFTFRYFNKLDFRRDYSYSDRDERHKFNFYTYSNLPAGLQLNLRMQAHSAQPITDNPLGSGTGAPCSPSNSLTRVVAGVDCGRNHLRKDNAFYSLDWRAMRPFKVGEGKNIIPIVEMFNTFNNKNNVNPLVTPGLFNFDGFLRQGVGDPRQVQLAVKFTF